MSRMLPIPKDYVAALLPAGDTIRDILAFTMPPCRHSNNIPKITFLAPPISFTNNYVELLKTISPPSLNQLDTLVPLAINALKGNKISFSYSYIHGESGTGSAILPCWVLSMWHTWYKIIEAQTAWMTALGLVAAREDPNAETVIRLVISLPWNLQLPSEFLHHSIETVTSLALYCHPDKWLKGAQINQMSHLLHRDHCTTQEFRHDRFIEKIDFFQSLVRQYDRRAQRKEDSQPPCRLLGMKLKAGDVTELGFLVNVRIDNDTVTLPRDGKPGNHWISVFVDMYLAKVEPTDSLGYLPPDDLLEILQWWLSYYLPHNFALEPVLGTPRQEDGFSCGIYGISALENRMGGGTCLEAQSCAAYRLQWLGRIVEYLLAKGTDSENKDIPAMLDNDDNVDNNNNDVDDDDDDDDDDDFPLDPTLAPSLRKPSTSLPQSLVDINGRPLELAHISFESLNRPPRPSRIKTAEDRRQLDMAMEALLPKEKHGPSTQDKKPKKAPKKKKGKSALTTLKDDTYDFVLAIRPTLHGGTTLSAELNKYTTWAYRQCRPDEPGWKCIGNGCRDFHASRTLERARKHAQWCPKIPADLRASALADSAMLAPSQIVSDIKARQASTSAIPSTISPPLSITPSNAVTRLVAVSARNAREMKNATLDIKTMVFFCKVPSSIAACWEYRDMMETADPKYQVPTRDTIEYKLIPREQAAVIAHQEAQLSMQWNLTISYDGGTSSGREAFWLAHVSDDERNVYLVGAREATGESHTAVWVKQFACNTMDTIGWAHFGGLVCDSTGNTLLSRTFVRTERPIVIVFPDACHHISSLIKDIAQLPYFKVTIKTVRSTITFFHKSHEGSAAFNVARKDMNIPRGLEAVGKTRFGSLIYSSRSVQRNFAPLERVFAERDLNFDYCEEYSPIMNPDNSMGPLEALQYRAMLSRLVNIGMPACMALACMESNYATAGDFYLLWHAMIESILAVARSLTSRFPSDVQEQIMGIVQHRHSQIFNSTGNLYTPTYLTAAYLNPANHLVQGGIFKPDTTPLTESDAKNLRGIENRSLYKAVAAHIGNLIWDEVLHGEREIFTAWVGRAKECAALVKTELALYARHQYPYNSALDESSPLGILDWWRHSAGLDGGNLLPYMAVKIYSLRVNSMPEERTVSKFTSMSANDRSQLDVSTMVAKVQVRQFHQNEHDKHIQKNNHKHKRAPLKFSSIRAQFETVSPASSPEAAVENPEYDEEDDKWLDATPELIPAVPFDLDTFAILTHPRIIGVLSASTPEKKQGPSSAVGNEIQAEKAGQKLESADNDFNMDFE